MKKPPYLCLYLSHMDILQPFDDAQRGRLVWAMLRYADTGEEPTFTGVERFAWPGLKGQLDRDIAKYADRCEKNRANALRAHS